MPNFVETYRQQNRLQTRREIAKDLLVVLVLVKYCLEYMLRDGSLSVPLGAAMLIAGVIAIAVRLSFFGGLLSFAAVILFFVDIYFRGGPYATIIFGFLMLIAILFYIFMRIFSR